MLFNNSSRRFEGIPFSRTPSPHLSPARRKRRGKTIGSHALSFEALEDRAMLSAVGFEQAPGSPIAVDSGLMTIEVDDFNGDGHLDLATAGGERIQVLRGDGSGSFAKSGVLISAGSNFNSMKAADLNGDGAIDLALTDGGNGEVFVWLNDGSGDVNLDLLPPPISVGAYPIAVAIGDIVEDGHLDLAIVDRDSSDLSLLRGDGTGEFATFGSAVPLGGFLSDVAIEDFNGDGHLDLAIADDVHAKVLVLQGFGDGEFAPFGEPISVGGFASGPTSLVVKDFNEDGYLDLATANTNHNEVSVLRGNGSGGFTAFGPAIPVKGFPHSVKAGDFDGDGHLDLATANDAYSSDDVSVLQGDGSGGFSPLASPFVGGLPKHVVIGDFREDGAPDLATANSQNGDVSVLLNTRIDVTVDDVTILEGDSGVTNAIVDVSLSRAHDESITLDYALKNGTATAGEDFENTFGSLTFLPGQINRWIVVPVIGDLAKEADETFTVRLANATFGRIADDMAVVTILDDHDAHATVESVVINDGSVQRSMITSLTVTFSDEVTLESGAFELTNQDGVAFTVDTAATVVGGKTVAALTFSGAGIIGGSLPDGAYTLTVRGDRILDRFGKSLDGDSDGVNGGNRVDAFFRRFGDSDGDGDVDGTDQRLFKSAFKTELTDNAFLALFDYDGDGDVDQNDRAEFNQRYRTDDIGSGGGNGKSKK
jgi:hypothetical protein